jgi:hypothetical protein
MPVHPYSPDWYVGGSVLVPGRGSSIVEITRFQLQQFTVSMKELAELFGLEAGRLESGLQGSWGILWSPDGRVISSGE